MKHSKMKKNYNTKITKEKKVIAIHCDGGLELND